MRRLNLTAAVLATLLIATFFVSTALVELLGTHAAIERVKGLIVTPGLWILIPAIAVTGATGFRLASGRRGGLVARKKKRMPFIAANGVYARAARGGFDAAFYAVQGIELIAGAVNFGLMALNARDGLRLTERSRTPVLSGG